MSEKHKWQEYVEDPRTVCKYGLKCFQKNPDHHKIFKHPPDLKKNKNRLNRYKPYSKDRCQSNDVSNKNIKIKETKNVSNEPSVSNKTESDTTESRPNNETNPTIQFPETLTYYDKDFDRKIFKELFLVEMPSDFFKLYECLNQEEQCMDKILSSVNLQLIGPYDLLLGKLPEIDNKELYLIHWRYFYDPPEFQTVLKTKGNSQYHIGYFRDNPNDSPVFLASNDSSKDCHIIPVAYNIFGAIYLYLQNEKNHSPFTHMACLRLSEKVKQWAETHNYSLEEYDMRKRRSQMVTRTFHGAGIVVPVNRGLGYRHLVEYDGTLEKIFKNLKKAEDKDEKDKYLSELQPVITNANIAVDECDFGTGLEIGIDLFCSGLKELEPTALSSLRAAYSLLNREAFIKIFQAHLKYRRKGSDMSLLSLRNK